MEFKLIEFNFDYWKDLYASDPEEADRQRLELLHSIATKFKNKEDADRALAKVYVQIRELDRIKNPLERFNQAQVKFWQDFSRFQDSLHGKIETSSPKENTVIPFPHPSKSD